MSQSPEPKRRGRPFLTPGQSVRAPVRAVRMPDDLWAEFQRRGGAEWLRAILQKPPA